MSRLDILFTAMLSLWVISPFTGYYIDKAKKPKLYIALMPMLIPFVLIIWGLLPLSNQEILFQKPTKSIILDGHAVSYYSYDGKLYFKESKGEEYLFTKYNMNANYARVHDGRQYELVKKE